MTTNRKYSLPVALVLGAGLLVITAAAQTTTAPEGTREAARSQRAGALDSKTTGASVRASKLIGTNIQNVQGENLGEIKDIVLDANAGEIQYVAVTYGGFLGLGNKLFAVPMQAIQCRSNPDDPEEYVLVMNVTKEQLKGVEGFDEDSWPNFADRKFLDDLYKRYGVSRDAAADRAPRDRDVDVRVGPGGVDVNIDRERNE